MLNTHPREVLSNIVQQLIITHGDLLSVQAAVERSALGNAFHESEIANLQKLDHATQFVDAITTILRNLMVFSQWDENAAITVDEVLSDVCLGSIHGLFLGKEKEAHSPAGEMDFF
ncbi:MULTISPECIES: hypothetical protein [Asaia]|uniref:hypothetical protein n=1 Tax=Asaia TaxID=91914 RepID=UPI002FC2D023